RTEVLEKEPRLEKFIRRVYGSREFIQNIERYCFWLADASPEDIKRSRILYERVGKVKEFRLASKREATQKQAETPHLFADIRQPKTEYLLIPRHSSGRRQYVPFGFLPPEIIATDACMTLTDATPYHLGILSSRIHMAWMRVVCGRILSDYRYSNTIVYNNFVWPAANPYQVMKIFKAGQKILDVREKYSGSSYAALYDELTMPKELRNAHRENDEAVSEAYGLPADLEELAVVEHMMKLNYSLTGREYIGL
ncbi:MAG: hypothetical protein IJP54_04555, partial [Synergistaceae bacterium]|nr:hypothetical protein [Synergistaceae bacterium]